MSKTNVVLPISVMVWRKVFLVPNLEHSVCKSITASTGLVNNKLDGRQASDHVSNAFHVNAQSEYVVCHSAGVHCDIASAEP